MNDQNIALVGEESMSLTQLAARINEEYLQAEREVASGLIHARVAGELLRQAKSQLSHGEWLPWLRKHCRLTVRTAQTYMRVASRWPELEKCATVAHLGLRDGLRLLADHREGPQDREGPQEDLQPINTPLTRATREERRALATQGWDIFAQDTVLRAAAGWTADDIADFLGMPVEEVEAVLNPVPPTRFDSEENGRGLLRDDSAAFAVFVERYHATVQEHVSHMLRVNYLVAAVLAKGPPRPEDIQKYLEARTEYYEQRQDQWAAQSLYRFPSADEEFDLCALCCAHADARTALGIDTFANRPLLELWAEFAPVQT